MSQEEANYRPRRAAAAADDEGRDWSSSVEPGAADAARGSRYADDAPDSTDKGTGEPSARGRRAFDDAPLESEDVAETQHSPRRGLGFSDDGADPEGSDAPRGRHAAAAEDQPGKQSLTQKVAAKASAFSGKLSRDKSDEKSKKPGEKDASATAAAKDSPAKESSAKDPVAHDTGASGAATAPKSSAQKSAEQKPSEAKSSAAKESGSKVAGAKEQDAKKQNSNKQDARTPDATGPGAGATAKADRTHEAGKGKQLGSTAKASAPQATGKPQTPENKAPENKTGQTSAAAGKAAAGSSATTASTAKAGQGRAATTGNEKSAQKGPDFQPGPTGAAQSGAAQSGAAQPGAAPSGATAKGSGDKESSGKGSTAKVAGAAAAGTAAGAAAHAAKPETGKAAVDKPTAGQGRGDGTNPDTAASRSTAAHGTGGGEETATASEEQAPKPSPWARPEGALPTHHRSSRRGGQGGRPTPVQPNTQRPDPSSDGPSTGSQPAVGGPDDPHRPEGPVDTESHDVTAEHSSAPAHEPPHKHRLAWVVSAVALVAVIALVSWAAVTLRGDNVANAPTGQPQDEPAPVLTQDSMLNDTMAKDIDPGRTWTQSLSSDGIKPDSPSPACINPTPDGQPMPNISLLRGNEATPDTDKEAVLHRADAYNSPEEAAQIFNVRSSDLGGCTGSSFYVEKGYQVEGLGDQALAVRLVLQDKVNQYHTVLLVRTGTVVNIYDVARNSSPVAPEPIVKAASNSINAQCGSAVGLCASPNTTVKSGIPPVGGDEPGFLATGDIPRITPGSGSWNGTATNSRINIQDGTGCEAVDFNTTEGPTSRQHRTYVLRNDPSTPGQMGVDEVVLTMGNAKQAGDLVTKVSNNISGCSTRTLTGEASKAHSLTTPGEGGTQIKGNWFTVTQKVDEGKTAKYRVGVFSAGQKFVYIRSNAFEKFDFVDEAWVALNLRAGERLTQSR